MTDSRPEADDGGFGAKANDEVFGAQTPTKVPGSAIKHEFDTNLSFKQNTSEMKGCKESYR